MNKLLQDKQPFAIKQNQSYDLTHGFLPIQDPLKHLPKIFTEWEQAAQSLPKLFAGLSVRKSINQLGPFAIDKLKNMAEIERSMLILSFLGHAYVWCDPENPAFSLPENLAVAWYEVARKLRRPPVLSYPSYALYNWYRLDAKKPVVLGNIALLQNFTGGIDEEWFILIHIEIEALAASGLNAVNEAFDAVKKQDVVSLTRKLTTIANALTHMCATLRRMPEFCDPYIYFNRVRPYIHGWKANPTLHDGLIYNGVEKLHQRPKKFKGETGAQSGIIPTFDRALKITHEHTPLHHHLVEMRHYMPYEHKCFIESIAQQPSIRDFVIKHANSASELKNRYNECIELIGEFRAIHLEYAAEYIHKQSQFSNANPNEIGTGGTPFMSYLRKHREETYAHLL